MNATSCSASGSWGGAKTTSGSETISNITASGTYTLTCTGGGGSAGQAVMITVSAAISPTTLAIGDRVLTTENVNVRTTACTSGKPGKQKGGKPGTILEGPQTGCGYTWWKVNFDSGSDGWVVQEYLTKAVAGSGVSGSFLAEIIRHIDELLAKLSALKEALVAGAAASQ